MVTKSTNLQLTRFLAAALVIFHHSFILVNGNMEQEWLWRITGGQLNMGELAVGIFFLCGGYLAARSVCTKKQDVTEYITSRLIRILPALLFVVVLCILGGSFISTLGFKEYFANKHTYRYLLNGVMILQHDLPGVFENAAYTATVNGSLWTLPLEFLCNMGCYLLFRLKLLDQKKFVWTVPIVLAGSVVIWGIGARIEILKSALGPCLLFYIGIFYWVYHKSIKYCMTGLMICAVALIFCGIFGVWNVGFYLFLPYLLIVFWFESKQRFTKISELGKYSYSMYLWGFPIQQFIAELFNWNMSSYLNAAISIPFTMFVAICTYQLIEKRAILLKNIFMRKHAV